MFMEKLTKREYIENLKNARTWKNVGYVSDTEESIDYVKDLILKCDYHWALLANNFEVEFIAEHTTYLNYLIHDGIQVEETREYFKNSEYYRIYHNDIGYLVHVYHFANRNGKTNTKTYSIKALNCS